MDLLCISFNIDFQSNINHSIIEPTRSRGTICADIHYLPRKPSSDMYLPSTCQTKSIGCSNLSGKPPPSSSPPPVPSPPPSFFSLIPNCRKHSPLMCVEEKLSNAPLTIPTHKYNECDHDHDYVRARYAIDIYMVFVHGEDGRPTNTNGFASHLRISKSSSPPQAVSSCAFH